MQFGVSQAWLCIEKFLDRALGHIDNKQVIADAKLPRPLTGFLHVKVPGVRIGFEQPLIGMVGLLAGLSDYPLELALMILADGHIARLGQRHHIVLFPGHTRCPG
ncbi:MAG: hypothetical protein JO139_09495 [Alphaproteobacteria bacterium]|nr:hypothetical protein [Alphaproteobacteria bacterium]